MADIIKVEVASSGEVWDIPGIPAPSCEDVVKSLGGGTLLDSNGLVVLQSRNLEAGKHYKLYPQVVPAGPPAPQAAPFDERAVLAELLSRLDRVPSPEDVEDKLFSSQHQRKIPVNFSVHQKGRAPDLLEAVVSHEAPSLFNFLIDQAVEDDGQEKTTVMMGVFVPTLFDLLAAHLPGHRALTWGWSGNQAENKKESVSTVSKGLERPDMLIWADGATVYIGEDKGAGNIEEARQDVEDYVSGGLPSIVYGDVPYIFAHAAAGSKVQLGLIMANGEVHWMEVLDLSKPYNRALFVSALVTMVGIIRLLIKSLPDMKFRRIILETIARGNDVYIQFRVDRKTIKKLPEWCTNHAPHPPGERAIDVLKAVYRVCDSTFGALVHTVTAPEVSLRAENYTVETQLCGPPAKPSTAEHVIKLAETCCTAAAELHRNGLVHRDFRLSNVVMSDRCEGTYTVIDMEHAGRDGVKWPLELLKDWDEGTLGEGRCYTSSSDVYQIGRMLHTVSSGKQMPNQFHEMVKRMRQKSITAQEAAEKARQMLP